MDQSPPLVLTSLWTDQERSALVTPSMLKWDSTRCPKNKWDSHTKCNPCTPSLRCQDCHYFLNSCVGCPLVLPQNMVLYERYIKMDICFVSIYRIYGLHSIFFFVRCFNWSLLGSCVRNCDLQIIVTMQPWLISFVNARCTKMALSFCIFTSFYGWCFSWLQLSKVFEHLQNPLLWFVHLQFSWSGVWKLFDKVRFFFSFKI